MAKYENSKADKMADKKMAKKSGVSVKKYESSKADKAMDRAAIQRKKGM